MYAVKKTRQPYGGRQARARQLREVELLWRIPNSAKGIVKLFNAWEQSGHLFMQFELCERGNLADYLDAEAETDRRPSEARAWAILAHAANALGQVHAIDIVHLDVKPANFLLGDSFETTPGAEQHEGWLKLADFGHATQLPYESQEWVEEGDREYMAPEVLQGRYSKPADVFSLGMMMLEIVANIVLPDNGVEWQKLREGCFDDANFIDLPYSSDLLDTIKWMLTPDPDMRPTAGQIVALDQCRLYTGHPHAGALVRSSTAVSVHPMTTRSAAHAQQARPLTRKHSAKPQQAPQSKLQSQRKTTRSNPTLARRTASAAPAFPT
ncbi:kinase-like protein [Linderina pennispora]|uniref:Kinase-like protein n=1 Tax=Linderina pennispora TaxID=61395 RepID=A0A1Y1WB23_9FUNG|nr:kinase-like protein [Linderina pennispora]ORX70642.1 kinase-like protein [Linderina pennispora]